MSIQKLILDILMKIEIFFLQFLKIKDNRISFISLESQVPTDDFKCIYDALDKNKYDIKLCLISYNKNLYGQFLYLLNCFKQLYCIYTSRLVIISDNNYCISKFKREGVQVLQVWHACGAIKKFGNAIQREYPISNYDYVLANSSYWNKPYSKAFSVKEENVLTLGMPRVDELLDQQWVKESKDMLYKKYPQLVGKKVIVYAPTFRGNIYKGFTSIPFDSTKLVNALGSDYYIVYKFHPLLGDVQLEKHPRVINMNSEDTHRIFTISDFLISDYSSVVFDYMLMNKPIVFYTPDLESYDESLGTFVDIESTGYPICRSIDEVIKSIRPLNPNIMKKNKDLFFLHSDGNNTKRVIEWIDQLLS